MSKRELILKSSTALFLKKGYKNLNMSDIADYAGISKKTLYNYFPGKYELIEEAIETKLSLILNEMERISNDESLLVSVKIKNIIRFAAKSFTIDLPLARIASEDSLINDIIFPAISEQIIRITDHILTEGIEKGLIRDDLMNRTPPYIFLGIIEAFMNMERRYGIKTSADELFIFIEKAILEGVLSDKGRENYRKLGEKK